MALPVTRRYLLPMHRVAMFEVAVNLVLMAALWWLMVQHGMTSRWIPVVWQEGPRRLAAYLFSCAVLLFLLRGGTYLVRGVLAVGGTMPPLDKEAQLLNHGRLIGDIERLILALLVAKGQYAALAFFFAAKGLIRSKDVELRVWADYLLLGSLTSFFIALVGGMLIARLMSWH